MNKQYLLSILSKAREYISSFYPTSLIISNEYSSIMPYIEKFLSKEKLDNEYSFEYLKDFIYSELLSYSILTKYIQNPYVDEININSFDDISVTYSSSHPYYGKIEKINETFFSSEHALDVIRKLLRENGAQIDYSSPITSSYIESKDTNIRISAIKSPVIKEDKGICASIRILHNKVFDYNELIKTNFISSQCYSFLSLCLNYGVSMIICGRTSSGKTTLCSSLLQSIPNEKRIFTIEEGSREFSLERYEGGKVVNNVISTLTKDVKKGEKEIRQEDLLFSSLRFNPDIIAVGEIRNEEAHAALEASLTGHTVISTLHSGPREGAHTRISLLTQRKFPIDFSYSLHQSTLAFPLVVFCHKDDDGVRHVMDVSEYVQEENKYNSIFKYNREKNEIVKLNNISQSLKNKLENYGCSENLITNVLEG